MNITNCRLIPQAPICCALFHRHQGTTDARNGLYCARCRTSRRPVCGEGGLTQREAQQHTPTKRCSCKMNQQHYPARRAKRMASTGPPALESPLNSCPARWRMTELVPFTPLHRGDVGAQLACTHRAYMASGNPSIVTHAPGAKFGALNKGKYGPGLSAYPRRSLMVCAGGQVLIGCVFQLGMSSVAPRALLLSYLYAGRICISFGADPIQHIKHTPKPNCNQH